ncbi:MAG: hypothetical protein A2787_05555 [Omnitrophica WOR_2 bacterium RIFCSPHIGHO2_01_FULL_48_9]|nr:MAG: hypothetical protein A3D10_07760 [Omnitrophica WOR_2 bacterium RIFCSPHIGHO2_02_FULL_48_11]OGX32868.1 MAG: hypothetical protein A2787_05555 [Omnitrophica WOR_2 bacterium RIFCSPHIGHO2_01_FULL_48_9]
MKNKEIADLLDRIGVLLEIKDDNVFKIRAYHKAAENIASVAEDIATLRQENRLSEIPGIGKAIEEKIAEYLDTGKIKAYQELIQEIPETLLDIVNIPSIGPKKAKLFWEELRIKNVDELRWAAEDGKLLGLPGIKEKTIENILSGIKVVQAGQERMNLGAATQIAEQFVAALKSLPEVKEISVAGSLRRSRETIRDIDILVDSTDPQKVMETFVCLPQVKQITVQGDTKSSVLTKENVQVDLRVVEPKSFGAALLYFTGSKNFNVKLRQVAMKKNMKVNEYGIFRVAVSGKETCVASCTEEECLNALGLGYIPPELREDIGESELFSGRKIPKLIELKDIRGDLHVHSTWSDGRNTIAQMAETAQKLGYEYLSISDHSPRLRVAGGVSPENLKKKKKEIEDLNSKLKNFRILFGTEVEIDSDGNLDYNEKILSEFDIVIAAIHSGFEQKQAQLTKRLVKACQSKYVTAIAHPTGVHLGKREPYDIDLKEICKAAVDTNTFLEINSFPVRLDLNSHNVYFAHSQGVQFVINSDAHSIDHLPFMKFGVAIARRGWLTKEDVLNTLPLKQLEKVIKNRNR